VDLDKAVVCRKTFSGKKFEILVDPKKALELKRGGKMQIKDVIAYPAVYKDASSTDVVAEEDLQKVFGTTDVYKVAERIIREGELQLTTEQRREMIEQKKIQIAEIISRRGINPQTNSPHPTQRILGVMEKTGVNIDPFVDAEQQVDKVLKLIKPIIPIKFQKVKLQLKIPPQYSGRVYSVLKGAGTISQEKWLNDGSLQLNIEVLGGMQSELFDKLSKLTHGSFESKVVSKEDI
jgi:ribosome maturation protein SDO1